MAKEGGQSRNRLGRTLNVRRRASEKEEARHKHGGRALPHIHEHDNRRRAGAKRAQHVRRARLAATRLARIDIAKDLPYQHTAWYGPKKITDNARGDEAQDDLWSGHPRRPLCSEGCSRADSGRTFRGWGVV